MPQIEIGKNANSLKLALEQAQTVADVWSAIRSWRGKRKDAFKIVAQSTSFWDEGLVQEMAGDKELLSEATGNPAWPQWATDSVMDRVNQVLSAEVSTTVVDEAGDCANILAHKGLIKSADESVIELISKINLRGDLTYRGLVAARASIAVRDLAPEWINHITGALTGRKMGVINAYYMDKAVKEISSHPNTTDESKRRLQALRPQERHRRW